VAEESFDCHCGEAGCRRRITPADAGTLAPAWDAAIAGALRDLDQVPQPLGSLLCPEFRERAFARYGLASPL
jgi:hypothetical protein